MLLPNAEHPEVAEQAHLSKQSLLNLTALLKQWSGSGNSDNLLETEEEVVPFEATTRAELVEVMARILVTVFQTEPRGTNESPAIQSQDQARTLGS